jgi:SAM-dependent methyltransferase
MMFDKAYFEKIFKKGTPWGYSSSRYEKVKYTRQIEIMKRFIPDARNILEIGCAEGTHTAMIAQAYPNTHILCLDIAPTAVEKARRNCEQYQNIEIIEADIIELLKQQYFSPERFDIVVQSESLYMLFPRLVFTLAIYSYFRDMKDIMKKSGIFVTTNGMKGLTRLVMPVCYAILNEVCELVHESTFHEWNDYRNEFWNYDLKVFQRTG